MSVDKEVLKKRAHSSEDADEDDSNDEWVGPKQSEIIQNSDDSSEAIVQEQPLKKRKSLFEIYIWLHFY